MCGRGRASSATRAHRRHTHAQVVEQRPATRAEALSWPQPPQPPPPPPPTLPTSEFAVATIDCCRFVRTGTHTHARACDVFINENRSCSSPARVHMQPGQLQRDNYTTRARALAIPFETCRCEPADCERAHKCVQCKRVIVNLNARLCACARAPACATGNNGSNAPRLAANTLTGCH